MRVVQMRSDAEFTACWQDQAGRVLAYATRQVGMSEAPEVVSETFLQAWRRWDDVPDPAIPWLIATARRVIANQRRGARRRQQLDRRLEFLTDAALSEAEAGMTAVERDEALRRLLLLTDHHREAVLLVSWDGLSIDEAARVAGIRPGAFRGRLHRARTALNKQAPAPRSPQSHRKAIEGAL
jgi:RNA polymerase sigma-70 factor, ECF subfamily